MINELITIAAKYFIAIPLILTIYYFFKFSKNRKKLLFYLIIAGIINLLLSFIAGNLFYNPRPFVSDGINPLFPHAPDNGFPSDHTLLAATLSSVLFLFSRSLGYISWIFTILVGIARVLAGVHHLIDIIGSIVISIIGTYLGKSIVDKLFNKL